MTIPFKKLKVECMKGPAFSMEYDRLKPEYELVLAPIVVCANPA